jgi:hypothetical protein
MEEVKEIMGIHDEIEWISIDRFPSKDSTRHILILGKREMFDPDSEPRGIIKVILPTCILEKGDAASAVTAMIDISTAQSSMSEEQFKKFLDDDTIDMEKLYGVADRQPRPLVEENKKSFEMSELTEHQRKSLVTFRRTATETKN